MRVLLTGAFGYLGSRLIEDLRYELVLGARSVPTWAEPLTRGREVRTLDVLDPEQIERAVQGVDAIVHLASLDENEAVKDSDLAVRVGSEGTRRLLDASRRAGVKRFVYLSTFHVYGPDAPNSIDENAPIRAAHPYAIARVPAEGFCFANNRQKTDLRAVVLRMSNGYGAPVHPAVDRFSLAHNDFCRQAVTERRIVLRSSGHQHRDFVWIGDVARAISLVLEAPNQAIAKELFHVGGGTSMRIVDLAFRVQALAERKLGHAVPIERPAHQGPEPEPVRYAIDALKALGYAPTDAIDRETERLLSLFVESRA